MRPMQDSLGVRLGVSDKRDIYRQDCSQRVALESCVKCQSVLYRADLINEFLTPHQYPAQKVFRINYTQSSACIVSRSRQRHPSQIVGATPDDVSELAFPSELCSLNILPMAKQAVSFGLPDM